MDKDEPVLHEFVARKEQVLNLETRLFVLVIVIEALFLLAYVYNQERVRHNRWFAIGTASVYFVLFFEMIAIAGKIVVVSAYLRQLEVFMASRGHTGIIWESKALDEIIFRPGNAFTLPAGLTILCLFVQTIYVVHISVRHACLSSIAHMCVVAV